MKCAMWNVKCGMRKAGVSLVTVLLFMLVATIAATATYKWITSEGRSSASRMMQREAYQSAVAGIESARSWMTYHANETGALIKQYKEGGNLPIKLNDQLAEFVRAGQSFDVWLVGVNTESSTYKLKLMSTGKARNGGASHSEIAILNVTGLYQIKVPKENVSIDTDFKYAYFGGSLSYEGESNATAMVVNGNWSGRPPKTANGDFVVTGNATLGGNLIDVSEYACIGGNLTTNNGFKSHYLYVHGNTTNFTGVISGDAYFDGDMSMSSACGSLNFYVQGNMTVGSNAKVKFGECQNNRKVDGNTCVIENGQIQANGDKVFLNGGAWMSSDYPIWRIDGSENATNVIIGKDNAQKVYIKNGHAYSDYEALVSASYKEEGKRNCPNSFTMRGENYVRKYNDDYNWQGNPYVFSPPTSGDIVNVCGSLGSQTASLRDWTYRSGGGTGTITSGKDYFVDYTRGWTDWDGQDHSEIFPSKANSMEGKYYIYNAPTGFLTFDKERTLDNWRKYQNYESIAYLSTKLSDGSTSSLANQTFALPIYMKPGYSTQYSFDNFFHGNTVQVGTYMFEGTTPYYEASTDANSYYRYVNNKPTGSPYCNQGGGTEGKYRPSCHVLPWFTVNGSFQSWTDTKPDDMTCAEGAKTHCYNIWKSTPGTGCDGSNFTVEDQLQTAYDMFKDYADRVTCSSTDHASLHTCWQNAVNHDEGVTDENDKLLYNGYMVMTLTAEHFKNENTAFEGKYIIIIESGNGEMIKLPPTKTENDFVMLYLPNGFMGQHIEGIGSGLHNYFIYTEKDIRKITGSFNLNGTIYGKIGSGADKPCAKVRSNNNVNLMYNESLMSDMMLNGLLCKASATSCGGPAGSAGSSGSASGVTVSTTYISDSYYVSLAPQLSITLESQYENNETIANVNNAKDVEGSFVVLPRVVFITKDAVGKLENYYKVVTLNSSTPATVSNVSCTPAGVIPVTGNLTQNGNLIEDLYTCVVKGSVSGKQQNVPFYVKVSGEGADIPKVSFMEESAELAINGTREVKLNWEKTTGVGLQCKVTVAVSDHDNNEWGVTANGGTGTGPYEFTINTSNDPNDPAQNQKIFDVLNKNSSDGAVYFLIVNVDGCKPGNPATEVIYNANTVTIRREGLEEYCQTAVSDGGGSGTSECEAGGEYYIKKSWPSCFGDADEELWVTANGQGCKPNSSTPNDEWTCGITSNVSLAKVQDITGCVTIFPSGGTSTTDAPFQDGDTRTLYADIKAVQQMFHVGFAATGTLSNAQKIGVSVAGPGTYSASTTCSYEQFKSSENRPANCDIGVYRGSVVTLTLNPEPGTTNANDFNYWKCEPGSVDCSTDDTHPTSQFQVTVTGENTVYAHFGEKDKHCFFDEFKDVEGTVRYNRTDIECSDGETYCIDDCGGTCASVSSAGHTGAKWKLVTGSMENLVYENGVLSFSPSATRGMREADKAAVKAEVLSTAVAGVHGELKAQFQVPFEGVAAGDIGKSTAKNSGFILRSTSDKESYLLLNIFAEHSGALKTRLCLKEKNKEDKCSAVKSLGTNVSSTSIVMASVEAYAEDGDEKLSVTVWPSSWSNLHYDAVFTLTSDEIPGVEKILPNEYVGFSLANQNFKIHGIGWKSSTYGSQCWDTFPTISCSFKANFAGGIVPKAKTGDASTVNLKPWTGLSAWYGTRTCTVKYYYLGDDASCGDGSAYEWCGADGYSFSAGGAHGYIDPLTSKEVRTAKVTVDDCQVYGEEASWATNHVAAHCGKFWVGDLQQCTRNYTFTLTTGNAEGDYYKLSSDGKANLRDALVRVDLDNPNKSEVEIYLFSQNTTTGFYDVSYVYSLPYKSNQQSGVIEVIVDDLSTVDGFDPENVVGIYVKTFGDNSVTINSVQSVCSHVISISGCSATYNVSAQKWEISTVVNNYSHTTAIAVSGESKMDASTAPSCNYPSPDPTCVFGNVGTNLQGTPQATNVSDWADNPYAITGDDTYNFTVTLTTDDSESEPLTCNATGTKTGISASCGTLSRTTVTPGGGLPVLQNYSISNCPDNQCKYKIKLVKDGGDVATIVDETTTGDGYWDTPVTSVNGNGNALAEGTTYKYVLTSENTARAFVGCESATFTIAASSEGVVTGECSFENTTVTAGSTVLLNVTDRGEGARWDERSDVQNISAVLSGGGTTSNVTVNRYYNAGYSVTAPTAAGTYTYSITYDGNTFCTASLTVETVADVLSATCPDIETFPLLSTPWGITMEGYSNLTNTVSRTVSVNDNSWNKDCSKNSCGDMDAVLAPAAVGEYTYTLTAGGTSLCTSDSRKYVVKNPLECYVDDQLISNGDVITLATGESFKFKAAWASGVGNGNPAECVITGSNVTSNGCWNNQSVFNSNVTITPSGTGDKAYTYSVKLDRYNGNITDAFTCNWTMRVTKPDVDVDCPEGLLTYVVGSTATFNAKKLTGCADGCDWTIGPVSGTAYNSIDDGSYTSKTDNVTFEVPNAVNSSASYTFTVYDHSDDTRWDSCEGTMAFVSSSSAEESSSSVEVDGVICLTGEITTEIPAGTYSYKAYCGSNGWGYNCTNGYSITFGTTDFECKGSDVSSWNNNGVSAVTYTAPADGILIVPSGAKITKIWCPGINGQLPEGCTSAGFKPNSSASIASSSSEEESSSSDSDDSWPATCGGIASSGYSPGQGHIYLKVTNFRGLISSDKTGTLSCPTASITRTTSCKPGNGSNGECDQIEITAPSTPDTYACTFTADGVNFCRFDLKVNAAMSCSIKQNGTEVTSVASGSTVVFRGDILNTSLSLGSCGFKIDGQWLNGDQNPHGPPSGTTGEEYSQAVSKTTTFTYECKQGQISDRSCSKTVTVY